MRSASPGVLALARELPALLDEQIALLTLKRSQLEALSTLLVQRDEDPMERLLAQMEQSQALQADTDLRLSALRSALADELGGPADSVRLGALLEYLPQGLRESVAFRREQIADLADQTRRQHLQTSLLLMECSRINRLLIEALFGQTRSCQTYDPSGAAAWQSDAGLVDAEI
jgi:hypothetical protein